MSQKKWYYANSTNQPVGPLRLDDLRKLFAAGMLTPQTFVVEDGGTQWRAAGAIGELMSSSPVCPGCGNDVKATTRMCPVCHLSISDYEENRKHGIHRVMQLYAFSSDKEAIDAAYASEDASGSTGCSAFLWLIASVVILILPIIGWIMSPICAYIGLYLFIAPSKGRRIVDKLFNPEKYAKMLTEARSRSQQRFKDVQCLGCNHKEPELCWPANEGRWDCPKCGAAMLRQDRYLFKVPKPDAVPRGRLLEMFSLTPMEQSIVRPSSSRP